MGELRELPRPSLTEEQKTEVQTRFTEFSGGFHPGEAGEEAATFLEEYADLYGRDELEAFLDSWGEEALAAEAEQDGERRKERLRLAAQTPATHSPEVARGFVKTSDDRRTNMVYVGDTLLSLGRQPSLAEAKAQWSDLLWLVQKMLESGAENAWLEFVRPIPSQKNAPGCGICENKGTFDLATGDPAYCVCPNGRSLKKSAQKGTVGR